MPKNHPDCIHNLPGVNDTFEKPINPDLILNTASESIEESTLKLVDFILNYPTSKLLE